MTEHELNLRNGRVAFERQTSEGPAQVVRRDLAAFDLPAVSFNDIKQRAGGQRFIFDPVLFFTSRDLAEDEAGLDFSAIDPLIDNRFYPIGDRDIPGSPVLAFNADQNPASIAPFEMLDLKPNDFRPP